jgi:hypothetical protein
MNEPSSAQKEQLVRFTLASKVAAEMVGDDADGMTKQSRRARIQSLLLESDEELAEAAATQGFAGTEEYEALFG